MFYYPTRSGCPTKPNTQTIIVDLAEGDVDSIDGDAAQPGAEGEAKVRPPMVSVYWQDRLVPETTLSALPFLPDCKTPLQCGIAGIPTNWRDRIQGFLFFGWDFRHISNNKLKFQVDPNMNEWLNNKNRFKNEIETTPTHLSSVCLRYGTCR
jgi:hypothetical protein